MKKILLIILLIVIIVGSIVLVAINVNGREKEEDTGKIDVVVSNFASYDFLRAITKDTDNVDLNFILGPGKDAHSYEPSPQDMIDMQNSEMFVYIGGDLEQWSDKIVETFENPNQKVIQISDAVVTKEEVEIEGAEHGHDHGDEEEAHDHEEEAHDHEEEAHEHEEDTENAFDSHIWTSPENAILMVQELEKQLSSLDSENSEKYKKNAEEYINQIKEVDSKIQAIVDNEAKNKLIFGDKMPMQYFIEYYGLDVSAAFQGCSTETEPTSKTIEFLVDVVKNESIPVVLYTELNDGRIANLITSEANNGSTAMKIQTLHNVTKDNFDNGATWVSLMTDNIAVIEKALK